MTQSEYDKLIEELIDRGAITDRGIDFIRLASLTKATTAYDEIVAILIKNKLLFENADTSFIPDRMFTENSHLYDVYIPSNIIEINDKAFEWSSVHSLITSDAITNIGDKAFAGSSLEYIKIGSGLKYIAGSAFLYCDYLDKIEYDGKIFDTVIEFFQYATSKGVKIS